MTSLISDAQKSAISAVFDDIHDTFARDIIIYREKETAYVSTNTSPIYRRPVDGDPPSREKEQYTTRARIKYIGVQGEDDENLGAQTNLDFPYGSIRLKINQGAFELIRTAEKINVDGRLFKMDSEPARPGPFSPSYYTIVLVRDV